MINDPTILAIIIFILFIHTVSKLNESIKINEVPIKTPNVINTIDKTKDVLNYIIKHHPSPNDLTISHLTQLIYLIDWEMTKKHRKQITDIDWYLDTNGVHTSDTNITDKIRNDENLVFIKQQSNFGTIKFIPQAKNTKESLNYNSLTSEEIKSINKVIEDTKEKAWFDFMAYVNSTKPITDGIKYDYLDLNSFVE